MFGVQGPYIIWEAPQTVNLEILLLVWSVQ